jgi:hypothetical protein
VPIPLPRVSIVRRQRTLAPLVQGLPTATHRYTNEFGGPIAGWVTTRHPQQPTKRVGDQVTDSEDHSDWRKALKDAGSLADIGGDFFTQKHYLEGKPTNIQMFLPREYVTAGAWRTTEINGPMWAVDARLHSFPPSGSSSDVQLDALGATAISRCKPTNSSADIGLAIAELIREGIPKLTVATWKGRARDLRAKKVRKDVAGDYLGYQFGLAPLASEVGSFAAQVLRAEELLAQYERDAGKVVRRRYEFPTKTESSYSELDAGYPVYMGIPYTGTLNPQYTEAQHRMVRRERTTVQKRWFSGAFTYYLPTGYDARNELDRKALLAKEILGLDLDLEVLWNLTPWSWAVDWFSNVGDVVSNISSFLEDGLLMRYGYMMEHTIVKDTYTRLYPLTLRSGRSLDSSVTMVTETKLRRRANPFGFGLAWDGLSTFQASILAALGISRGR